MIHILGVDHLIYLPFTYQFSILSVGKGPGIEGPAMS